MSDQDNADAKNKAPEKTTFESARSWIKEQILEPMEKGLESLKTVFASNSVSLPDGSYVEVERYGSPTAKDSYFASHITKNGVRTTINADTSTDVDEDEEVSKYTGKETGKILVTETTDKTIDVVGKDGVEHYIYTSEKGKDGKLHTIPSHLTLHEKMVKASLAIRSNGLSDEEARKLKKAHELVLGSMVDQPDGSAQLDESKLPNVMKAYDAVIKEGQRGL